MEPQPEEKNYIDERRQAIRALTEEISNVTNAKVMAAIAKEASSDNPDWESIRTISNLIEVASSTQRVIQEVANY